MAYLREGIRMTAGAYVPKAATKVGISTHRDRNTMLFLFLPAGGAVDPRLRSGHYKRTQITLIKPAETHQ